MHVARNVTVSVFYFYKQKTQSKVNKFCEISKHLHEQIMLQKTFLKIYHNFVPYPDISTVSVNSTTSDLSFVSVKSPIPMSAGRTRFSRWTRQTAVFVTAETAPRRILREFLIRLFRRLYLR